MDENIIKINLVEVASELAHDELINGLVDPEAECWEYEFTCEDDLYEEDGEGETSYKYKDFVQDIFNEIYDEFYDRLYKLKLND